MTSDNLPYDADRTDVQRGDVPAGGAGADSGAGATVNVEAGDTAAIQNVSSQNDIAGVGTRGPERVESSVNSPGDGVEQESRAADPDYTRDDEAAGAAAHNARVSDRDSDDPERARADDDFQHLPRMAQNAPTRAEELNGIVAQTRADMALGMADDRARDIIRQRLDDAGIGYDDDTLDELARQVLAD